jgi:hypothetical protein
MASGILAAFMAVLAWGFVEGLGRFYPAKPAWRRLRAARGRYAVRRMRERFEDASKLRTPRRFAFVLLLLLIVWVGAAASLLDKRWYEVLADVAPTVIVTLGFLRIPAALRAIAARMRDYEASAGEDPDQPLDEDDDDGDEPSAIAL